MSALDRLCCRWSRHSQRRPGLLQNPAVENGIVAASSASDGCVVSRVTMSARAPAWSPTVGCPSAWAPPASAASSSARPVDAPGAPDSTLRCRCFQPLAVF